MTVTEDRANNHRASQSREDIGGDFPAMRTPPHDPVAEQAVLGSMLLSKDAIADVVDKVDRQDFYRPDPG